MQRLPQNLYHESLPFVRIVQYATKPGAKAGPNPAAPTPAPRPTRARPHLHSFGAGPKKGPDGTLALTRPMGDRKLPGIAAEDIGRCAQGIFQRGGEYIGKTVGIAGEHLTGEQMAAALTKALDQEVRYNAVPPEVFRSFGFPGAEDLGNMFQFKRDFEAYYCGARSLDISRSLNPSLQSFEQWLTRYKDHIPLQ